MPTEDLDQRDFRQLVDGVVDSILEAPEEELDADIRARGEEPDEVVRRVGTVAESTIQRHHGKKRLHQARQEYEARVEEIESREYDLPESMAEQRRLLTAVFQARPEVAGMVTVQFRDLRGLPDADVTSCLRQLAELGVLDALQSDGET